jgi:HEAT repeat protein
MNDARIVPALSELLGRTDNEQLIESIAEALTKRQDTRAIPALKATLQKDYDPFLKLTVAKALVSLDDKSGYDGLVKILRNDDAGFARSQALEDIRTAAGNDFGYNPEKSVAENKGAIEGIEKWVASK